MAPISCATRAAAEGVACGKVTVETITASRSEPCRPARSRASRAAPTAMTGTVSSAVARWRVTMPVRWRIHSSDESMGPMRSSLGTRFAGR